MVVYLDTNVYIGAKYIFDCGNFGTLKNLIAAGKITVLYTSATIREVKQHIETDIGTAITQYNRLLRKDMPILIDEPLYNLTNLDVEQVVNSVTDKLDTFSNIVGVEQISLNPLDGEKLVADYFNQIPPFESKKPNEFKDAIMINAIKQFQSTAQSQICIVSNDDGFKKSFENDANFVTFNFLSEFLRYYNQSEIGLATISEFLSDIIASGELDDAIEEYLSDFDVDRGDYGEWHCDGGEIDEISCELLYIEEVDGKYVANISVDVGIDIDITYRDEDTSYYDKEEGAYLIEHFIHATEKHCTAMELMVVCDIKNDEETMELVDYNIIKDNKNKYINLDEGTLHDREEIENTLHEEPDLVYCNECGALLGRTQDGVCFDYSGNPLCSKCAVTNSNGSICPACGLKVPQEYMMSGFCKDCSPEFD